MSGTPLSAGLANWHWRQKQVDKWAYDWFKTNVTSVSGTDASGVKVDVTGVKSIEGDVTVGQRKSKIVTIYDLDMTLSWTATLTDGSTIDGTVQIPEVSHEAIDGLSDYSYNFTSSAAGTPAYLSLRKFLPSILEPFFTSFRQVLVEVHGKDMLVSQAPSPASSSGAATPAAAAPAVVAPAATSASSASETKKAGSSINTSEVSVSANLQISAADLWNLLTNEQKIPSWSRSAAQFSPTPNAPYSLFSSSVRGIVLSSSPPSSLRMTWALKSPSWPEGHEGILNVALEQGTDSTKVTFRLEGVPKGKEREIESNLQAFYIRGFVAMGLVQSVLPSTFPSAPAPTPIPSPAPRASKSTKRPSPRKGRSSTASEQGGVSLLVGVGVVCGLTAVLGGLVWNSLR